MIKTQPLVKALPALAGVIALTACTESSTAGSRSDALFDEPVTDAIASVNGIGISEAVFDIYVRSRTRQEPDTLTDEQRESLLGEIQDLYLLANLAKERKLDRDPEVIAQLNFQRFSILAGAMANDYLTNNEATDEEVRAEYERTSTGDNGKEYKARHILLETEEEAVAVIAELDGGADFAELAKEKSTGPSGPNGGDLGWFPPNRMVPPFSAAVVALEDNAYSKEPVKTQFGWHVILREESRDLAPPPFETVEQQLKQQLGQKKFREFLEAEKEKATLSQ